MAITPWDPFHNLLSLQDRMNRLFDETVHRGRDSEHMYHNTWTPPVDILESDDEILLLAEIPGIELSDVEIHIQNNTLTLKGERAMRKTGKDESYHRVERTYGAFTRSFTLPATVDRERITAGYDRGILEVKLPKTRHESPRQIKIAIQGQETTR